MRGFYTNSVPSTSFPVFDDTFVDQQQQGRSGSEATYFPSSVSLEGSSRCGDAGLGTSFGSRRVSFSPNRREYSSSLQSTKESYPSSFGFAGTRPSTHPLDPLALAAYRQHATEASKQNFEKKYNASSNKKRDCCTRWIDKMGEIFSKCFNRQKKKGVPDISALGGQTGSSSYERIVHANDRNFNTQFSYADNYIKTSKYNLVTFVPKNLFEQFQRLANFYFLVLMILQFIPWITSIVWYSTAIPLAMVLAFSAIKDAYDDIQRHRSDHQVNSRISYVVRDGRLRPESWMNVKVGDIIRMENGHFIAADLLLLSSSEPHGLCYIETAELDGETNLKTRAALPETVPLGDVVKDISSFDGEILCEAPNNRLDRFEGMLTYKNTKLPLSNENMLLRGCRLKNTRWCYGVVIFAGRDTKLMMNSGKTKFKRTSLDRFLNILIMGIVLFLIAMCLICTILCGIWEYTTGKNFTSYLPWDDIVKSKTSNERGPRQIALISFLMFFSYIILLNTVVPISLYVSVEIIRFVHSMWINFDVKMYDAENDVPARARTTTLNEELGQVQYIFSDKTGTLTQNIMTFNKCSINGKSYGDILSPQGDMIEITKDTPSIDFSTFNKWSEKNFKFYDRTLLEDTKKKIPEVHEFWKLLALCHTVMPERKKGIALEYQAQSPDEAALTSAARNFGYVFKSRTPQSITIEVNGKEEVYEVLHLLDFNNVRKRMSVIVKDQSGKLTLYCKGADTIIMDMVKKDTSDLLKSSTMQHLDKFASDGLRTLCIAYKSVDEQYCKQWLKRLREANLDRENKEKRVDDLYEEMEGSLTLLGATAIEDKLQDGVPETIALLTEANIKIWVLTGDKTETAINIGYSCHLLTEDMKEVFVINGKDESEVEVQLKDIRRRIERSTAQVGGNSAFYDNRTSLNRDAPTRSSYAESLDRGSRESLPPQEGFALVINGNSLVHALKPQYERMFLEIGCLMMSVICCRVTPLQKAQVVDLVKRHKKAVTLSIGDGANDVSMIKTAHIGVGISGKEGMQAVISSDFSIGQFRFLQRLLLVHGRWSYYRMCKFLRYFFYKNFSFTLTNFWYSFFSAFSAETVYDPLLIACYNLFFTALPVLAMGVFDQDVSDEYSLKYPKLYIPGQYNLFFNMRIFIYSVIHGIVSSIVLFFIPYGAYLNNIDSTGHDINDYTCMTFTVFTGLIVVVTGQIMLDTACYNIFTHIVIWGSLIFYVLLVMVVYQWIPYNIVAPSQMGFSYGVIYRVVATSQFWFSLLLIIVILLFPVLLNRFFWFDTHPSYADRLRYRNKLKGDESATPQKKLFHTTKARRSRRGSLRSGYAFSHSPGFGELIAKGKLFKNIEHLRLPSIHSTTPSKSSSSKQNKEKSKDSRPSSALSHNITVNQGDDPLPSNWSSEKISPPANELSHPGYTSYKAARRTPQTSTSFPSYTSSLDGVSQIDTLQPEGYNSRDHVLLTALPFNNKPNRNPKIQQRKEQSKVETEV